MSTTDFGDPHQNIHIPARDLTGTREAKLAELDMFLAQLQGVRLALCGRAVYLDGSIGGPSESRTDHPRVVWNRPLRRLRTILNHWGVKATRTERPAAMPKRALRLGNRQRPR